LLLFLAIGVGHQILVRQFDVDSTAEAVEAVYDSFLSRLITWLWIVDIGGVLVTAAATATFRTTGARGQFEGLRRSVTRLPTSRPLQLAYSATSVMLGAS